MIPRHLAPKILAWTTQYPVVTITGPRQSGKTTLCKALFPHKPYVSLEDMATRNQVREDPRGFLARYPEGAILDEIQRAPDLPSYLQGIVDERNVPGMFILTGSQQFELMAGVSQSLAGRTAIARLLPFSYAELYAAGTPPALDAMLYAGFYPRIHDMRLDPSEALAFYVSTYVERDIRQIVNIRDFGKFESFIKLLAGRSGQLLNLNSLGSDCGLSHGTMSSWVSALEQGGLLYIMRPYSGNLGKRLLKTPKLYLLDTGLLCYLLGIYSANQLSTHPLRGHIFESFAVAEFLKIQYNHGFPGTLLFYRDQKGEEVDLVAESASGRLLCEIKSSATWNPEYSKAVDRLAAIMPGPTRKAVILGNTDHPYIHMDLSLVGYPYIDSLVS